MNTPYRMCIACGCVFARWRNRCPDCGTRAAMSSTPTGKKEQP